MPRLGVTVILAVAAAAAIPLLLSAVRQARTAGDVDEATWLTLAMALVASAPVAIAVVTGGVVQEAGLPGQTITTFPSWYHQVDDLAKALIVVFAAGLLIRRVVSSPFPIHMASLFALSLWVVAGSASALRGGRLISLSSGTLLACLLASVVLPRRRGACLGAAIAGVVIAIASGLAPIFEASTLQACARKCSFVGAILNGVLPNANLLGIVLGVTIPFVYVGIRGRARYWLTLYMTVMVMATGARTAMIAAGITLVMLLIVRPRLSGRSASMVVGLPWVVIGGALTAWLYIAGTHWASTAVTDRGALWNIATQDIHKSPLVGYGPDKWSSLATVSQIPTADTRSAHSQFLDLLFSTGWVGAALCAAMVLVTISSSGRARGAATVALGTIMMIGVGEGTWQVGSFDYLSFTLVAFILIGEDRSAEPTDDSVVLRLAARRRGTPNHRRRRRAFVTTARASPYRHDRGPTRSVKPSRTTTAGGCEAAERS